MPWSITIANVAGSEIRIHVTFLLLLAWIAVIGYAGGGASGAIGLVAFVVAVFACVVLHELGHALAARRYGIRTPDITLLPIGGLARLSRMPDNPGEEIVIALAGPAVNVVIAAVLILLFGAHIDIGELFAAERPGMGFADLLATVNVFLVLFNLIPAFPMDGGRVLRAALAIPFGRRQATDIAARTGQAFAFLFGFFGLVTYSPLLVFIAIFVYLAAAAEAQATSLSDLAGRLKAEQAMVSNFETLGPQATVDDAADALIRTTQGEFPIVDGGGRIRGVLTRNAMIRAMRQSGDETPVLDVMHADVPELRANARLSDALKLMQEHGTPIVAVIGGDGRMVGYISQENLAEMMMLAEAGHALSPPAAPAAWSGRRRGTVPREE